MSVSFALYYYCFNFPDSFTIIFLARSEAFFRVSWSYISVTLFGIVPPLQSSSAPFLACFFLFNALQYLFFYLHHAPLQRFKLFHCISGCCSHELSKRFFVSSVHFTFVLHCLALFPWLFLIYCTTISLFLLKSFSSP